MVTRSIDVDNTNDCISRRSVFIGSGAFSTTILSSKTSKMRPKMRNGMPQYTRNAFIRQ